MTEFITEIAILGDLRNPYIVAGGVAAVLGVVWYWLLYAAFKQYTWLVGLLQIFLAVGIATMGERALAMKDPGIIVIDEFVAVSLIFLGIKVPKNYHSFFLLITVFLVFLLLDGLKPFGISYIESLPQGLGIVGDDVAAALLARGLLWFLGEMKNNNLLSQKP